MRLNEIVSLLNFFYYFMYVLCLHDEAKHLPIGKRSSRSTLHSSLLTSPTHIHLYSYEYQHANACSLTRTYACAPTRTWTYTYMQKNTKRRQTRYGNTFPSWGFPCHGSYADATDVMKTWAEAGFHPERRYHFLRLKGGQESENMLLTFLKSS